MPLGDSLTYGLETNGYPFGGVYRHALTMKRFNIDMMTKRLKAKIEKYIV